MIEVFVTVKEFKFAPLTTNNAERYFVSLRLDESMETFEISNSIN